jgi:hypothetical protein
MIWIETEGETTEPPSDFQTVDLARLTQPLEPGRYRVKLNLHAMTAAEAENTASTLVHIGSRHRIPVWLGLQGAVGEPGASLARHAHRVKILAALEAGKREFWETQRDLLKQSVKAPTEWLAVNHVPWYRW